MHILELLSYFEPISCSDGQWRCICPCHDFESETLRIKEKENRILVHCFRGCTVEEITEKVGINVTDLFNENGSGGTK